MLININNERKLKISVANTRHDKICTLAEMTIGEFYTKLATPVRSAETLNSYNSMSKSQKDNLKDVGGFIGGELHNGIRKAGYVTYRDVISLDFDNVPAGGTDEFVRRAYALDISFCLYSTRNHTPEAPRFRLLIPTDRSMTADEYEPIARMTAKYICKDMSWLDRTTFDISRIMYWPSCCADSQYVYHHAYNKPLISANGVLGQYNDWRDMNEWPLCPSENKSGLTPSSKQKDPLEKIGVVGAFCRTYTIQSAISKFLSSVYVSAGDNRYTYAKGSTTGGAVVYDNKYLYSHHATDPACDTLCNAFDLVRIHLFGEEDDKITTQTPPNRLPSYKSMAAFAKSDPTVAEAINSDKLAEIEDDFGDVVNEDAQAEYVKDLKVWFQALKRESDGESIQKTAENILITLNMHPRLKGRLVKNDFAFKMQGIAPLPWGNRMTLPEGTRFDWDDADTSGLLVFIEKCTKIHTKSLLLDALNECWAQHSYHPVRDYLNSLVWDGNPRLARLFIDYLGADDTDYVKAVTTMTFVAAISRIFNPGIKFDTVTVLVGAQGLGKSSLINIMAKKSEWFTDSLKDLSDRSAVELIQGTWLVELGEMSALNKTELNAAKAFITRTVDKARMAYERFAKTMPRSCIFFGTSNTKAFLKDPTGDRRYLPIDCHKSEIKKRVFYDLPHEVDQLWAEAFNLYNNRLIGLTMPNHLASAVLAAQQEHSFRSEKVGLIEEFLLSQIPADWAAYSQDARRLFYADTATEHSGLVNRKYVCALEIWCECFNSNPSHMHNSDSSFINDILRNLPGLKEISPKNFPPYGKQRGFEITDEFYKRN